MVHKKTVFLTTLLSLLILLMTFVGQAHAATLHTSQSTTTTPCSFFLVISHGSQPATATCADRNTSTARPNSFCSHALDLYWDANGQGLDLCFTLGGEYNMTDFSNGSGVSWNDQASSFQTGCTSVTFYKDINRGGPSVTREPHHGIDNFTAGSVPNDSLSSVFLFSSC